MVANFRYKLSDDYVNLSEFFVDLTLDRHIDSSFDHSSTATWVYVHAPAKKVTIGCFPIEALRSHGLLNDKTTQINNMIVKMNKRNYSQ